MPEENTECLELNTWEEIAHYFKNHTVSVGFIDFMRPRPIQTTAKLQELKTVFGIHYSIDFCYTEDGEEYRQASIHPGMIDSMRLDFQGNRIEFIAGSMKTSLPFRILDNKAA